MQKAKWFNIGRPGPYGNPFIIGRDGTRAEVVAKHRAWFLSQEQQSLRSRARRELTGKRLWCPGCRGTLPCHKTVIEEEIKGDEMPMEKLNERRETSCNTE